MSKFNPSDTQQVDRPEIPSPGGIWDIAAKHKKIYEEEAALDSQLAELALCIGMHVKDLDKDKAYVLIQGQVDEGGCGIAICGATRKEARKKAFDLLSISAKASANKEIADTRKAIQALAANEYTTALRNTLLDNDPGKKTTEQELCDIRLAMKQSLAEGTSIDDILGKGENAVPELGVRDLSTEKQ
jgi:hypothetical protein